MLAPRDSPFDLKEFKSMLKPIKRDRGREAQIVVIYLFIYYFGPESVSRNLIKVEPETQAQPANT